MTISVNSMDQINEYNDVLTYWIQLRQGDLSLHIESFPLQSLFDLLSKGRTSFLMKGVTLDVQPTETVVKADKVLTLFMLNTLADNARKFTPRDGRVSIFATDLDDRVEIAVEDTGQGMTEEAHRLKSYLSPLTSYLSPLSGTGLRRFCLLLQYQW